jgi:hypothetical protein
LLEYVIVRSRLFDHRTRSMDRSSVKPHDCNVQTLAEHVASMITMLLPMNDGLLYTRKEPLNRLSYHPLKLTKKAV